MTNDHGPRVRALRSRAGLTRDEMPAFWHDIFAMVKQMRVITSYSIHYTKLYDVGFRCADIPKGTPEIQTGPRIIWEAVFERDSGFFHRTLQRSFEVSYNFV